MLFKTHPTTPNLFSHEDTKAQRKKDYIVQNPSHKNKEKQQITLIAQIVSLTYDSRHTTRLTAYYYAPQRLTFCSIFVIIMWFKLWLYGFIL